MSKSIIQMDIEGWGYQEKFYQLFPKNVHFREGPDKKRGLSHP